jgi:hypothetical protein
MYYFIDDEGSWGPYCEDHVNEIVSNYIIEGNHDYIVSERS